MKVSVCIITYNHAPFIRQAIDSVLMQKTSFDFEVLIGEDDSNDGTREIVKEYATKYPEKIRLFLHNRKDVLYIHGRPTGRRNLVNNLKNARGQYIALLEGDDYWISPDKLQKQADFLEAHPECSLCFHDVLVEYEDGSPSHPNQLAVRKSELAVRKPVYSLSELLDGKVLPPTGSVMIRNWLFPNFPDWYYRVAFGDISLFALCAEHGDMGFINESMGVYRVHKGGFWSRGLNLKQQAPLQIIKERFANGIEFCEMMDMHLDGKYHPILSRWISELSYQLVTIYQREHNWTKMRIYWLKAFRAGPTVSEFGWAFVIKSSLVAFLPFFYRFYRRIRPHHKSGSEIESILP